MRKGYTLVELLAVSVLSLTLLAVAVAGFRTWIIPAKAQKGVSDFAAEVSRARTFAISRGCQTRLEIASDGDDALIALSRHHVDSTSGDMDDYNWRTFAPTGRMEMAKVTPARLYFRPDGSCTTNEDDLASDAEFATYTFMVLCRGLNTTNVSERYRVDISARTGLSWRNDE